MRAIATLVTDDHYLSMSRSERIMARRDRKARLASLCGPVQAPDPPKLEVAEIEPAAPTITHVELIQDWVSNQISKYKPLWFGIESEVGERPRPLIEQILRATAKHYDVSVSDILSARRTWPIVKPRQVAMYLSKIHTLRSLPEIGRRIGDRDHTTVLHAVRKIERMKDEPELAASIAAIELAIEGMNR